MSVDQAELKRRWRGLVRRFPVWRLPIDLVVDLNSWRMFGADLVTMIVDHKGTRMAARELDGASPEMLDAISGLSTVNVARTGELFRIVLLTYVSLPLAFAALLSDAAPDAVSGMLSAQSPGIIFVLIGSVVFPILYYCGAWRAKQIDWTIQLYRAGSIEPYPAQRG